MQRNTPDITTFQCWISTISFYFHYICPSHAFRQFQLHYVDKKIIISCIVIMHMRTYTIVFAETCHVCTRKIHFAHNCLYYTQEPSMQSISIVTGL